MDIKEFSNKIADATKNMSEEEKNLLMKIFSKVVVWNVQVSFFNCILLNTN